MSWGFVALGTSVVSGLAGASASRKAAKAQVQATESANKTQREIFERQAQLQEPFRQADIAKQSRFMEHLGIGGNAGAEGYGDLASGFMPENWMAHMDPGYNFRLAEGLKALDRRAFAAGRGQSGEADKNAVRYGQDYASQEYQNAFSRYQTGRNATLNPLMGNSGSTNYLSGALGNMGNQISENQIGAGNARAAGYVGGANAWSNAITGGLNSYMNFDMFNNLTRNPNSQAYAAFAPGDYSKAIPKMPSIPSTPPSPGF